MRRNFRRICRITVANLLYYFGLFKLRRFFRAVILRQHEVCVLGLHRVLNKDEHAQANSPGAIILTEETFKKLLEHLSQAYCVVSLEDFLRRRFDQGSWSRPLCLITFDDGWKDNYTTAFPLLKNFRIPATVFLATGFIGHRSPVWVERLMRAFKNEPDRERIMAEIGGEVQRQRHGCEMEDIVEYLKHMSGDNRRQILKRVIPTGEAIPGPESGDDLLSWDQVMEMQCHGIEFGSHTVTHPLLIYEDDASVKRELQVSLETLQEKLHRQIRGFAYPNGNWDERVRRWVQEIGYECAFTTQPGWHRRGQDPYTVKRIMLHEGKVTGGDGKFSAAMFSLTLARFR